MPDWLIALLNNPVAVTALGGAVFIPFFKMLADIFMRRGPKPPPPAYDVRDLPDHPLLISSKVHLHDEDRDIIRDTTSRLQRIERQLDRIIEKIDHVNDRLD